METTIPVLRRSAIVKQRDDAWVVHYLASEITLEGRAASLFGRMLPHLDGSTEIGDIAARIQAPPSDLRSLAQRLAATGVISLERPEGESSGMSGERFYELHRRYCAHWLAPVYRHRLWSAITSGEATRAQVLGFAFEKYHYIEGAYEHMAVAAANATPEMMPHLARHFIEEYRHGDIYRRGLQTLFQDEVILTSQPLPSTRALLNFLAESAGRTSFGYYAGNEVLQMTENASEPEAQGAIDSFYDAMRRHYPETGGLIDAFIAHTNADQKLGHEDVFLQMCRSIPPLSRAEVRDALNIARSMAEHLGCFLDGIEHHYARFPEIPRLAGTLLSQ
jgi:hypothetical protein